MITKFSTYINEAKKSKDIFDAARNGDLDYIKNYKGDLNIRDIYGNTALMFASNGNNLDVVKYLVEKVVDLNIKNDNGYTALMFASNGNNLDVVKYLVEQGVDMDIKDEYGCTALMYASIRNYIDVVKYLIECGADINIKSNDGQNAYFYNEKYFDTYEFQKWYMDVIGNYEKLNKFVQGDIHSDIKKEYANDAFKMDLGL